MSSNIHPTAVLPEDIKLGKDVVIGPYTVIDGEVSIGDGTKIGNCVTLHGKLSIGKNCNIHPFSVLGGEPQDIKYEGETSEVIIGDNNVIREYVTIHRGTKGGGSQTIIGDNNLIMANVHIAHDCVLGNNIIMSNLATLGGHVQVQDFANIGGMAGVHHFVTIGKMSFVGGASKITQDVPPFVMIDGNPAEIRALNLEGMRRKKVSPESRAALKEAFRTIYRSDMNIMQSIYEIRANEGDMIPEVLELIEFIEDGRAARLGRRRDLRR